MNLVKDKCMVQPILNTSVISKQSHIHIIYVCIYTQYNLCYTMHSSQLRVDVIIVGIPLHHNVDQSFCSRLESIMLQTLLIMLFGISPILCLLCSFSCFLGIHYADNLYL